MTRIKNSKGGVALPYVIGVSALLMIVCAALFSSAQYNLSVSGKTSDGRQTSLTARGAVEFAKGELYRRAGEVGSEISIGVPSDEFYVTADSQNSFSVSDSKPTGDGAGETAHCIMTLEKSEGVISRTTEVWVEDAKITLPYSLPDGSSWTEADRVQEAVAASGTAPVFKEFPVDLLESDGKTVFTQITEDSFTRHTYQAKIEAALEYKNSKRSETIGYEAEVIPGFEKEHTVYPPPVGSVSPPSFTVPGMYYGDKRLAGGHYDANNGTSGNGYADILDESVVSDYPALFTGGLFYSGSADYNNTPKIKVTSIYLIGRSKNGASHPNSVWGYGLELELTSEFIAFSGDIKNMNNQPARLVLNKPDNTEACIVQFVKDVSVYQENKITATFPKGYYYLRDGTDLMKLTSKGNTGDANYYTKWLTPVLRETIEKNHRGVNLAGHDYIIENAEIITSGDEWVYNGGLQWVSKGGFNDSDANKATYPNSVTWKDLPADSEGYERPDKAVVLNNLPKTSQSGRFIVNWYISDTDNWESTLKDPENKFTGQSFNDAYDHFTFDYIAKEIHLLYVSETNNKKDQFELPAYRRVRFKADTISIQTQYEDGLGETPNTNNRPKITHAGDAATFILESSDGKKPLTLVFPYKTPVEYSGGKYHIEAGTYTIASGSINLFSDEALELLKQGSGSLDPGTPGEPIPTPPDAEPPGTTTVSHPIECTKGKYIK